MEIVVVNGVGSIDDFYDNCQYVINEDDEKQATFHSGDDVIKYIDDNKLLAEKGSFFPFIESYIFRKMSWVFPNNIEV